MKRLRSFRTPLPLAAVYVLGLTACITLLALWCQPNALRAVLANFCAQPMLFLLNALPIGLLTLALGFLTGNVFFGAAIVNFAVCGLSIANRIKLEVRDEPVFPRDLGLLKEVNSAMGAYAIRLPALAIATVIVTTALLVLLGVLIKCKPLPVSRLPGWLGRAAGTLMSLGVLFGLIVTVYASNDLYNSFHVSNAYYIPAVFNELGFPYCFCHQFTTYPVDRPEGFRRAEAQQWDEAPAGAAQGKAVNVVMVMDEAFSDITDAPAFAFSEEDEPLKNLHALRQDAHALTGHIVVPGFAGGTANTEFDVLTGMQTNALSATTTSAMRVINRNLDSLFRVFDADGYRTSYFHPGNDWFYNRENVYRWFGAQETVFIDQMESPEYKGTWVADHYLTGLIEAEFEKTAASGQPLFHFTTTIQNHMAYTLNKYGEGYDFPPVALNWPVSEETENMLRVYTEGVRDADALLGSLWQYFAQRSEPVVLVFFGDHLPYLGDNQKGYAELGLTQQDDWGTLTSYETPYVIWANDAAAEALNWDSAVEALELPETVSAAFLGASVLELTGRGDSTAWFSFLNDLRREAPVVQKQYVLTGGVWTDAPGESLSADIAKWRKWSYYKLRCKVLR